MLSAAKELAAKERKTAGKILSEFFRRAMHAPADHMAAHNLLGASVFWIPRAAGLGGEDAAVLDWQIKRDGTSHGMVEVTRND